MHTPKEFDDIRPFEPEELQEVYNRLLDNQQFQRVLSYFYPDVPLEKIGAVSYTHLTRTSTPVSNVAGLVALGAVFPLIPGSE